MLSQLRDPTVMWCTDNRSLGRRVVASTSFIYVQNGSIVEYFGSILFGSYVKQCCWEDL